MDAKLSGLDCRGATRSRRALGHVTPPSPIALLTAVFTACGLMLDGAASTACFLAALCPLVVAHRVATRAGAVGHRDAVCRSRRPETALATATTMRSAIDAMAIVSITDARGRIVDANEQFCQVSGYSRAELLGRDHRIVNSGHHPPAFWREMWRTIREGRTWRGEVCNRAKDGSLYWVHSIVAPYHGSDGEILGFLSVRVDITEQKRAIARALRSEAQLEQAQRVARIGSWTHDPVTGHVQWSNAICDILELAPAALGDDHAAFLGIVHADDRQALASMLGRIGSGTGPESMVHRLSLRDGRIKHVHTRWEPAAATADRGRFPVGTIQDVTASRLAELELLQARALAEAASQAKTEFLANMSHEIRTPLTAILGYSEILTEGDVATAAGMSRHELLEAIRSAGQHLLTVIDDILDLSKIEAGQLRLEPIEVSLPALMLEVESLLRERARGKGIALSFAVDGPIPERVSTDPTRLRQVLLNMIGNALKFTERGTVSVRLAAVPTEPSVQLEFQVADTGIGITAEQASHLFQPFSQANSGITRRFGGTGLGLTICRRLARALGGEVVLVQSTPGAGSVFRVHVDASPAPGTQWVAHLAATPSTTTAPPPSLSGRILLAEDGRDNQRLISHLLRRAGAEVDIAEDGEAAWTLLETAASRGNAYDLLVTDLQMPRLDGIALARRLRHHDMRTPVLALSAHVMAEDRRRCLDAGCSDFAAKPIARVEFLQACCRLLRSGAGRHVGGDEIPASGTAPG